MNHGFIKVAAACPKINVADTAKNADEIIRICDVAASLGVKLTVFPELCLTGATCGDLFLHSVLINGAAEEIGRICAETAHLDTVICIGAPIRRENKLYNCAVVIYQGMILGVVPKRNMPDGTLHQSRVFTPAPEKCGTVEIGGICYPFGTDMLFYCEGASEFNFACVIGDDIRSPESPIASHARAGATVICALSALPETVGSGDKRRCFASYRSAELDCGIVYAEAGEGESTTDHVFGGHRVIYEKGKMLAEAAAFSDEELLVTEIDVSRLAAERMKNDCFKNIEVTADNYYSISFDMTLEATALTRFVPRTPFIPADGAHERCRQVLEIQARGLAKRLSHTGAKSAVIGISGGLDSTLAMLVCIRAMDILGRPHSHVTAVSMPCFGTTERTRTNGELLSECLGVSFRCIDISAAVRQHFSDIGHDENVRDVVYENVQARERTQVIMDIANATGGIVIGTGDLSELALGFATYNGDHMSMYAVNADVPKTLIRRIVADYAENSADSRLSAVLTDILETPISPELLPSDSDADYQKTEEIVGPYTLHDFFLYYLLRFGFAPEKIERMANYAFSDTYSSEEIHKYLAIFMRRFMSQQFKRSCLPDGPTVGSVGVSPRTGLFMPSDASAVLFLV